MGTGTVNQGIEHLFHLRGAFEDEITGVFHLEERVLIGKTTAGLFNRRKRKVQTGCVQPTVADLPQLPYGMRSIRGICNLRQVCGLYYIRKTIARLHEIQTRLLGLPGTNS